VEVIVPKKDDGLEFLPTMAGGDLKNLYGAGRLTARKQFDNEDELQAYADLSASLGTRADPRLSADVMGAKYRKRLSPSSALEFYGEKSKYGEPFAAGVKYTKEFKRGGKVKMKSASARADGIAQKGKTRGKIV